MHIPAPSPSTVPSLGPVSRRRARILFIAAFLGLVAIDLGITWIAPSADTPQGYSLDHSLTIDGHWYLAEARATASDNAEATVSRAYRKPGISAPAAWIYQLAGISLASSRALSSLASIAVLALLAGLLRRRWGPVAAIAGVAWLAIDPAWHVFVRSPVVYPWVAFWMLAIIAIAAGREPWRWWVAVFLTAVAAIYLKAIVILLVPALAWDGWIRLQRWNRVDRRIRWGIPIAAVGLAMIGALTFWKDLRLGRFLGYLKDGDGNLWETLLGFEQRSQFFGAQPWIVLFATLSLISFMRFAVPARGGRRQLDRLIHGTVWCGLVPFVVAGYSPLRYLSVMSPMLVYLSASGVAALVEWSRWRDLESRGRLRLLSRGVPIVVVAAITSLAIQAWRFSKLPLTIPTLLIAFMAIGGTAVLLRSQRFRRLPLLQIATLLVMFTALPRLVVLWDSRDESLERAQRELAAVVLPSARILGPYAHAMTVENGLVAQQTTTLPFGEGRLVREIVRRGTTHLLAHVDEEGPILHIFEREGLPLVSVDRFYVRGRRVNLYRIALEKLDKDQFLQDNDVEIELIPRSRFEVATEALTEGRFDLALDQLRALIEVEPSGAAWSRLGQAYLKINRREEAFGCFLEATRIDPCRLDAHLALVEIYGASGDVEAALGHLRGATWIAPRNTHLADRLRELEKRFSPSSGK